MKILLFILEVVACIAGFYSLPKFSNSFWKWLPYFLLFVVVGEVVGYCLASDESLAKYNPMVFNYLLNPAQILFYQWLLNRNISVYDNRLSKITLLVSVVYVLGLMTSWYKMPNLSLWSDTFSYSIGMIGILINLLVFYFCFIKSEDLIHFKTNLAFWVSIGIFAFYVATLPFEALRNSLVKNIDLFMLSWYLEMFLACAMYLLFIIGFLWTKPK